MLKIVQPSSSTTSVSGTKIIMRILSDPIHFLGLLRFLLEQRIANLRPLESFAKQWLSKKSDIMVLLSLPYQLSSLRYCLIPFLSL
jgi:hypothetical protein